MLFNSLQFLIFFPIVVVIYYAIPKKIKYLWLLAASYYFYMCWNARYVLLLLFSTIVTWSCGIAINVIRQHVRNDIRQIWFKKIAVVISFLLNLGVLFFFKYSNFVADIITDLFRHLHIMLPVYRFDVLLPVGISFYTFQALGYTIDVYRGEIYAEKNFFRYALFVSFFPQLVAGPIERSKNLLRQLTTPNSIDFAMLWDGFLLMLWGYFLKIVLADRIAIFVDTVYGDYIAYTGWYLIVATVLFAVQIYCDFYGYSVIAIGAAEILGIQLMENFHAPYLSASITEFWKNWHVSLTSWFRDYLYIPLGGNRKGKLRKHINRMIVFLISGLWHGASFSFMIWGGLNGLYQSVGELLVPFRDKVVMRFAIHRDSLVHKLLCICCTFVLVDFSWIFFRANCLVDALAIVGRIVTADNPWILFDGSLYTCGLDSPNFTLMILCIVILLSVDICKRKNISVRKVISQQDGWFRCIFSVFSVCALLTFGVWGPGFDATNFIYFQF